MFRQTFVFFSAKVHFRTKEGKGLPKYACKYQFKKCCVIFKNIYQILAVRSFGTANIVLAKMVKRLKPWNPVQYKNDSMAR